MASIDVENAAAHAEDEKREWTWVDHLIWSTVSGVLIYAVFRGFILLLDSASRG